MARRHRPRDVREYSSKRNALPGFAEPQPKPPSKPVKPEKSKTQAAIEAVKAVSMIADLKIESDPQPISPDPPKKPPSAEEEVLWILKYDSKDKFSNLLQQKLILVLEGLAEKGKYSYEYLGELVWLTRGWCCVEKGKLENESEMYIMLAIDEDVELLATGCSGPCSREESLAALYKAAIGKL